jgi:hypothetical protein
MIVTEGGGLRRVVGKNIAKALDQTEGQKYCTVKTHNASQQGSRGIRKKQCKQDIQITVQNSMPAIIQTPEGILLLLWGWTADSQRAKDR